MTSAGLTRTRLAGKARRITRMSFHDHPALPAAPDVREMRSSRFPASCRLACSSLSVRGLHGRHGGGLSGQQEPACMAAPHAETWSGACRSPARRARAAGPADRRGARVPGGLEQQRRYPAATGSCGDSDSLFRQAFVTAWRCELPPDWRLDNAFGVPCAFTFSRAFGIVVDSGGDTRAVRKTTAASAFGR
jgi:hypothetical protein